MFTGSAEDFHRAARLLVALDTSQKQVLAEVTIAEVTLTDQTNLGVEWFFNHSMSNGVLTGGTLNGLGIGTSGLNLNYTAAWNGLSIQAAFDAFASNNKVNIHAFCEAWWRAAAARPRFRSAPTCRSSPLAG